LLQPAPASVEICHWTLLTTPLVTVPNVAGRPLSNV
jgi:hypothetical protein